MVLNERLQKRNQTEWLQTHLEKEMRKTIYKDEMKKQQNMISSFLEYYLQILYKLAEFHNGFLVVIFLLNSSSQLTFKLKSTK